MKTIMITGCSSGFGLETAKHFLAHGWRVIATMRTPREELLPSSENAMILPLDVTKAESITEAVAAAGSIDVLVNNAGIGLFSPLESTPANVIRDVFETNTLGSMAVIQAVLPQFRQRREGVIINVSSSVTFKALPFLSVYTASKVAMNAFTESLALELEPFRIRTHLILPGQSPETDFVKNASFRQVSMHEAYAELADGMLQALQESKGPVTNAQDVAQAVWRVATDPSAPMRLPAGADAIEWAKASQKQ